MLDILKTLLASPFEVILFVSGFFAFLLGVLPIKGKVDGVPLEGPFPPPLAVSCGFWGP